MLDETQKDEQHRIHPFTLPALGENIISPLTGTTYQIGLPIGSGAFGFVFHCTSEWKDRLAAKVLKPIGGDFSETEIRAQSEIIAQSLARSPHAVQIYDAFIYKGACYIISEYCESTLDELINRTKFTPTMWFPALAKAVLHSLHFIHVNGIAHCDIHLRNVFLASIPDALLPEDQSAFTFKLGDFGQARLIESMEIEGTFLDSITPPEVLDPARFGPLDYRADIYQAGILFVSFLTKTRHRFTTEEILEGRPRELAESLVHPCNEVIACMLRRRVVHRHPTALDVWRRLQPELYTQ